MLTKVPPDTALDLLNDQLHFGRILLVSHFVQPISAELHEQWEIITAAHLKTIFGPNSDEDEAVFRHKWARGFSRFETDEERAQRRAQELERQLSALTAIKSALEKQARLGLLNTDGGEEAVLSSQVFIIHGQNNAARLEAARFLEQLGLEPVILHERPNQGRTIIEKFEEHSRVGFAVALLTGDDRGGPRSSKTQQARARQNVIFELGYFLGKLGRRRVAALYEDGVEIPSDYAGVVYIPFDPAGGWRVILARELRDAGFTIDLNKVR